MLFRSASERIPQLVDGGLPLVLSQTFRAMIHSRMELGMKHYERAYPDTDIILIEPGPIATKIRENAIPHFEQWIDWENSVRREQYASLRGRLYDKKTKKDTFELGPEAVTAKLIHALESRRPKARYFVTTPTYIMGMARRILPTRMLDWLIAKG